MNRNLRNIGKHLWREGGSLTQGCLHLKTEVGDSGEQEKGEEVRVRGEEVSENGQQW